jgi:uncharacterized membrane protein YgcG
MMKIAAIIGGVLLMAGVAFAGTRTLLEQTTGPTLGPVPAAATTTTSLQDDRSRENEVRGRENEVGEDLSGPCDEAEHANDPRCTAVAVAPRADDDNVAGERADDDNRGSASNSGPSDRSGHEDGDDHSGHGGGGGNSGHGGGGDDD